MSGRWTFVKKKNVQNQKMKILEDVTLVVSVYDR